MAFFSVDTGARNRSWKQTRESCHLQDLRYSRDGRTIMTCGAPATAQVWDAVTGEELVYSYFRTRTKGIYPIDPWLSACGTKLLVAGDQSLIIDAMTGKVLQRLSSAWSRACFTPDCKQVISGSDNGNIRVTGVEDKRVKAVVCNACWEKASPEDLVRAKLHPGGPDRSGAK